MALDSFTDRRKYFYRIHFVKPGDKCRDKGNQKKEILSNNSESETNEPAKGQCTN